MPRIPASAVFAVDYASLDQVRALAARMGGDCIVVKHASRSNYNIVHKSRRDLWDKPGVRIVADVPGTTSGGN